MSTTLEIKNKVAVIYITTVTAINLSAETSLLDQPIETALRNEEINDLYTTGIDFPGKTTKEALLLIRDWLKEVKVA